MSANNTKSLVTTEYCFPNWGFIGPKLLLFSVTGTIFISEKTSTEAQNQLEVGREIKQFLNHQIEIVGMGRMHIIRQVRCR